MYTENKDFIDAKSLLLHQYNEKKSSCGKNEVPYYRRKYNHLLDCCKIFQFYINEYNYQYLVAILLHDIGRFICENDSDVNHANVGYLYTKKKYSNSPIYFLPIKYHEDDLDWETKLKNDSDFTKCTKETKNKIVECCSIVKDIDIISNMKMIISEKYCNCEQETINKNLINLLFQKRIGKKEMINSVYDKIVYILCGLNLIRNVKSFEYIQTKKIIEKSINKMRKLDKKRINREAIDRIEQIIKEKYLEEGCIINER